MLREIWIQFQLDNWILTWSDAIESRPEFNFDQEKSSKSKMEETIIT